MSGAKRLLIAAAIVTTIFGGLGVAVHAAERAPERSAALQEAGAAWLGVRVGDQDGKVVVVDVAPGSPAEDAGLTHGDVIVAVDDTKITSPQVLVETIQGHQPGDEVTLTVETGGESREVKVTLTERPADVTPPASGATGQNGQGGPGFRGMLSFLGVTMSQTDDGWKINAIDATSPLATTDLKVGDVITAINGTPVGEFNPGTLMRDLMGSQKVTLTVLRDGAEQEVEVDLLELDLQMPMEPQGLGMGMMGQPTQLGVQFLTLTSDIAAEKELSIEEGALIEQVFADTPAAQAGLQEGDIVTAVDGDKVDEEHTLADRLYAYEEGDQVTLAVVRGQDTQDIKVTLGPRLMMGGFFGMPGYGGGMMGPDGRGHGMGGWDQFRDRHSFFGQGGMFDFGTQQDAPVPQANPAAPDAPAA